MAYRIRVTACLLLLVVLVTPLAFGDEIDGECSAEVLTDVFSASGGIGFVALRPPAGRFTAEVQNEIRKIEEGSPAEKAGMQVGDGILAIDGRRLGNSEQDWEFFGNFHRDLEIGQKVRYTLLRGGEELNFVVTAVKKSRKAVELFVYTHLLFNGCPGLEEYERSIGGPPAFRG